MTQTCQNHVESGDLWQLGYKYGEIDSNGNVDETKNTGNVARQTLNFNGLAQPFITTYKYDSLYRLTEAQETQNSAQTWKQAFSYDRYGNRIGLEKFIGVTELTQTNLTHPAIDENTNRFNSGQGFAFDKNGNVITDPTDGGRNFVFNGDNKQKEVRDANHNLIGEYFYDGEGKRVKKKAYNAGVLSETTVFVYSSGKLVAEYSTAAPPSNPTTQWTVTDQLGSPRILTNSLGEVVSRRDFMPFGEEVSPDGTHRIASLKYNFGDNVRQKFTGYQKDEETSLDFAEARMYQNFHGRFTAVDPLLASGKSANPQTFNRYVYVTNNPLIFTDPTGLQAATKLWPAPTCRTDLCWGTSDGKGTVTANQPLGELEVTRGSYPVVSTTSVVGTSITSRLSLFAGSSGSAATAGTVSAAAPAAAGGCAAILCVLLADRIRDYTAGGVYDNTMNPTIWRDGLPYVRTTGSTNTQALPPGIPTLVPNRLRVPTTTGPTALPGSPDRKRDGNPLIVFHGTDVDSANDIMKNGLGIRSAMDLGGGDVFWTTTNPVNARLFAQANPAGRSPAVLQIIIPRPTANAMRGAGIMVVEGEVHKFLRPAWPTLNISAVFERVQ